MIEEQLVAAIEKPDAAGGHSVRPQGERFRFATPINYAAHGGFCTVNMAAAGLYSVGGAFWEFGEPDWELARLFLLIGVAEDHDSNPIKLGLGRLKERGAKIISPGGGCARMPSLQRLNGNDHEPCHTHRDPRLGFGMHRTAAGWDARPAPSSGTRLCLKIPC